MLKLVIHILISCLLISADANKRVFTDEETGCGDAVTRLIDAVINVTPMVLKIVMESERTVITAPLTNFYVLGAIAIVSEGNCREEILNFTKLENDDEIRCAFQYLNRLFLNATFEVGATFLGQLNLYADIQFNFTNLLRSEQRNIALSEAITLDFGDPEAAAEEINLQSSLETDGNIPFVISADAIENASGLISAASIFFEGSFETKCKTIYDDFFITPCESITAKYLNGVGTYMYYESSILKAQVLQLTFEGGSFSTLLIIPDKYCGTKEVLTKIQDPEIFYKVLYSLKPTALNISVPVLNVSTIVDTEQVLIQLNITSIYNEEENCIVNAVEGKNVSISASRIRPYVIVKSGNGKPSKVTKNPMPLKFNSPFIFIKLLQGIPILAGYFGNPDDQFDLTVTGMQESCCD